jgi:type I restriction enzyme S subunit
MSGNKYKWDFVSLGSIAFISAGGDKPNIFSKNKTTDTPIPVIANAIKNDGIIGYTNKPIIEKDSITISARGTIGYSSIRNYPYYPIVRLISIIPDDNIVDISYLKYIFDILYEKGVGTSIPQLTIPMIINKQIPLPPINEQKRIVKIIETKLTAVEKVKKAVDELSSYISALPSSILRKAFNGDY